MVEAAGESVFDRLEEALDLFKKYFFTKNPDQRSQASLQIEKLLRREKGKDASLGVDVRPLKRSNGIAYLTYSAISEVFSFLDSETVFTIHESAVDETTIDRTVDHKDFNKSKWPA